MLGVISGNFFPRNFFILQLSKKKQTAYRSSSYDTEVTKQRERKQGLNLSSEHTGCYSDIETFGKINDNQTQLDIKAYYTYRVKTERKIIY